MPLTPDGLLAYLNACGIVATTQSHPPVHTVAQARALRGSISGAHTKNLFLRDARKNYFLVAVEEETPVDLKALKLKLGARGGLSFGSPEALYEKLGVLPGAVTLLAAANDPQREVMIAIDVALLEADFVNCHPLTNASTTTLAPSELLRFLALTGHEPLRISFAEDAVEA